MTPSEINIVKSLIALAWADGKMEPSESNVVEGLLLGFDASEEEEEELLRWASTPRSLKRDVPKSDLPQADKELLLANAALLAAADGQTSDDEAAVLQELRSLLGFSAAEAETIFNDSLTLKNKNGDD